MSKSIVTTIVIVAATVAMIRAFVASAYAQSNTISASNSANSTSTAAGGNGGNGGGVNSPGGAGGSAISTAVTCQANQFFYTQT